MFCARIEESPNTHLVEFDSRGEMDCLIKYLTDEYPDQPMTNYAIGLQQPDEYKVNFNQYHLLIILAQGVYQWRYGAKKTLSFTNWMNTAPTDQKCVTMQVGIVH